MNIYGTLTQWFISTSMEITSVTAAYCCTPYTHTQCGHVLLFLSKRVLLRLHVQGHVWVTAGQADGHERKFISNPADLQGFCRSSSVVVFRDLVLLETGLSDVYCLMIIFFNFP